MRTLIGTLATLGALCTACAGGVADAPPPGQAHLDGPSSTGGHSMSAAAGPRRDPFDSSRYSTTDPSSPWVVVNKSHPITPLDFRPDTDLVRGYQVAAQVRIPLERLLAAGDARGFGFKIASAFRSYDYQASVYADTVAARGRDAADRVSARPGHSEHQTGLAVDLVTPETPACDFERCFADTPGGRWLSAHAWRFGFLVRYQPGIEAVTGYDPEPWHLRYVGRQLAVELRETGVRTLEGFFGITGGDYPPTPG